MVAQVTGAKNDALDAALDKMVDDEIDEWTLFNHGHGFWAVADDRSQSGAQPAAEDKQIAGCCAIPGHATFPTGIEACVVSGWAASAQDISLTMGVSC